MSIFSDFSDIHGDIKRRVLPFSRIFNMELREDILYLSAKESTASYLDVSILKEDINNISSFWTWEESEIFECAGKLTISGGAATITTLPYTVNMVTYIDGKELALCRNDVHLLKGMFNSSRRGNRMWTEGGVAPIRYEKKDNGNVTILQLLRDFSKGETFTLTLGDIRLLNKPGNFCYNLMGNVGELIFEEVSYSIHEDKVVFTLEEGMREGYIMWLMDGEVRHFLKKLEEVYV